MNELYKKLLKDNKTSIKQLTGEYKMWAERITKEIRQYAIKSQSTEKVIEEIILEFKDNYDRNIRFSGFITNINKYIASKKELCVENKLKQKFNLKEKIIIVVFIIVMIGITVAGILLKRPVSFKYPENIAVTENVITYDAVEGAARYRIIIYDIHGNLVTEISTKYTTYNLSNIDSLKYGVTYYIYLQTERTNIMEASDKSDPVVYTKK